VILLSSPILTEKTLVQLGFNDFRLQKWTKLRRTRADLACNHHGINVVPSDGMAIHPRDFGLLKAFASTLDDI
jgi:hypothetical protein